MKMRLLGKLQEQNIHCVSAPGRKRKRSVRHLLAKMEGDARCFATPWFELGELDRRHREDNFPVAKAIPTAVSPTCPTECETRLRRDTRTAGPCPPSAATATPFAEMR